MISKEAPIGVARDKSLSLHHAVAPLENYYSPRSLDREVIAA